MVNLGEQVFIAIDSDQHPETWVFGVVVAMGFDGHNPDGYWIELEGLTTRFYSDRVRITTTKKKGK